MDPNQINDLITQAKHKDDRAMEKLFAEFKPQLVSLVDTYYHKYPYNVYVRNNLHGDELFRELMYQEDFNDMLNELNIPTGSFAEILPYVAFEQAVAQSTSDYDLQSLLTTWVKTLFKKAYDSKTNGGTKPMPRFESQMMLENAMSRLTKLYRNDPACVEAINAVHKVAHAIMESEYGEITSAPLAYTPLSEFIDNLKVNGSAHICTFDNDNETEDPYTVILDPNTGEVTFNSEWNPDDPEVGKLVSNINDIEDLKQKIGLALYGDENMAVNGVYAYN